MTEKTDLSTIKKGATTGAVEAMGGDQNNGEIEAANTGVQHGIEFADDVKIEGQTAPVTAVGRITRANTGVVFRGANGRTSLEIGGKTGNVKGGSVSGANTGIVRGE
ncbi:hypothetical protein T440DRAFT_516907 [Plenodomus tracheiphilus IPT5]|uniref:Uncharacterized protein n=1 Tax=Plenodomus tracheiphilus IPT5 TaxID=1408161 RepID=A0A6A7B963_9PLEO|nr:hypothetical protein T440DRAFT_516907 [Plenodomus tracheiphilus IPT5]